MIKEVIVGACITALSVAGVYTKRGIDATYIKVEELEKHADILYVRQDVYQQTENQKRIWQLEDRIAAIKSRAASRPLTPDESARIKQLQRDIQRLK